MEWVGGVPGNSSLPISVAGAAGQACSVVPVPAGLSDDEILLPLNSFEPWRHEELLLDPSVRRVPLPPRSG